MQILLFDGVNEKMVGAVRFELTTSWTRTTRASQATLRPEPDDDSAGCEA